MQTRDIIDSSTMNVSLVTAEPYTALDTLLAQRDEEPETGQEDADLCLSHSVCGLLHQDPETESSRGRMIETEMGRMRWKVVFGFVILLCFSSFSVTSFADSFTFSSIPSAPAAAGSTTGWGYSITNNSPTNWLFTTALSADPFTDGMPLSLFDFPILGPLAGASVAFDAVNAIGLYQLTWDPNAPAGAVNSGNFTVSAEWWDGDPFAGGTFISLADDMTHSYSTTIVSSGPVPVPEPVPEPSTLVLVISGLLAVYGTRRKLSINRNSKLSP
jgi:hypothetical protein